MPIEYDDITESQLYGDDSPFGADEVSMMTPEQKERAKIALLNKKNKEEQMALEAEKDAAAENLLEKPAEKMQDDGDRVVDDFLSLAGLGGHYLRKGAKYAAENPIKTGKFIAEGVGDALPSRGAFLPKRAADALGLEQNEGDVVRGVIQGGVDLFVNLPADILNGTGLSGVLFGGDLEKTEKLEKLEEKLQPQGNALSGFGHVAGQYGAGFAGGAYKVGASLVPKVIANKGLAGKIAKFYAGLGAVEFGAFGAEEDTIADLLLEHGYFTDTELERFKSGEADSNLKKRANQALQNLFVEAVAGGAIGAGVKGYKAGSKAISKGKGRADGLDAPQGATEVPQADEGDLPVDTERAAQGTALGNYIAGVFDYRAWMKGFIGDEPIDNKAIINAAGVRKDLQQEYEYESVGGVLDGDEIAVIDGETDIGRGRRGVGDIEGGAVHLPVKVLDDLLKDENAKGKTAIAAEIRTALNAPHEVGRRKGGGLAYKVQLANGDRLVVELSDKAAGDNNLRTIEGLRYDTADINAEDVLFAAPLEKGDLADANYRLSAINYLSRHAKALNRNLKLVESAQSPLVEALRRKGISPDKLEATMTGLRKRQARGTLVQLQSAIKDLAAFRGDVIEPEELARLQTITEKVLADRKLFAEQLASLKTDTPLEKAGKADTPTADDTPEIDDTKDLAKDSPLRDYKNFYLQAKGLLDSRKAGQRYGSEGKQGYYMLQFFKGVFPSNHKMAGDIRQAVGKIANQPGFFKAATADGTSPVKANFDSVLEFDDDVPNELKVELHNQAARRDEGGQGSGSIDEREAIDLLRKEVAAGGWLRKGQSAERVSFDNFTGDLAEQIDIQDLPSPENYDNFESWYKEFSDKAGASGIRISDADIPEFVDGDIRYDDLPDETARLLDEADLQELAEKGIIFPDVPEIEAGLKEAMDEWDNIRRGNDEFYQREGADEFSRAAFELGVRPEDLRKAQSAEDIKDAVAEGITEKLKNKGWVHRLSENDEGLEKLLAAGDKLAADLGLDVPKTDKQTLQDMQTRAEVEIGHSGRDLYKALKKDHGKNAAGKLLFAEAVIKGFGDDYFNDLAKTGAKYGGKNQASWADDDILRLTNKLLQVNAYKNAVADSLSEHGRALGQAAHLARIKKRTAMQDLLADIRHKSGVGLTAKELQQGYEAALDAISTGNSVSHVFGNMANALDNGVATWKRGINEFFVSNILGATALGVNVVSNGLKMTIRPATLAGAGAFGDISRIAGSKWDLEVKGGASVADVGHYLYGAGRQWRLAFTNAKHAYATLNVGPFNEGGLQSVELGHGATLKLQEDPTKNIISRKALKGLSTVNWLNSFWSTRPLSLIDGFIQPMKYHGELQAQAARIGRIVYAETSGTEAARRQAARDAMDAALEKPSEDMMRKAGRVASEATSTQELPAALKKVSHIINDNPFLKSIFPFVKSPANDLIGGAADSVLGLIRPNLRGDKWSQRYAPRIVAELLAGGDRANEAAGRIIYIAVGLSLAVWQLKEGIFEHGARDPDWQKDWLQSVVRERTPQTYKVGDIEIEASRIGRAGARNSINGIVLNALLHDRINNSVGTDEDKARSFLSHYIDFIDFIDEYTAFSGTDRLARMITAGTPEEANKAIVYYLSIFNPRNQLGNQKRLWGFDDQKTAKLSYDNNRDVGLGENVLNQWAARTGAGPIAHDGFGVPKGRNVGLAWAVGAIHRRDYSDAEKRTAQWVLDNTDSGKLGRVARSLGYSAAQRLNGKPSSYYMTREEQSFMQSLRGHPIYKDENHGVNKGMDFADSWNAILDFGEKEGWDKAKFVSYYKQFNKRYNEAMKANFYNKFPHLVAEIGLPPSKRKKYLRIINELGLQDANSFANIELSQLN